MTYSELITHLCKTGRRHITQIYLRSPFTSKAFHKTYIVELPDDQELDVYAYWVTSPTANIVEVNIVLDVELMETEYSYLVKAPYHPYRLFECSMRTPALMEPATPLCEPELDWQTGEEWAD